MSRIPGVLLAGTLFWSANAPAAAGADGKAPSIVPVSHAHSYRHHHPRPVRKHRRHRVHREFEWREQGPYPYFFYYHHYQPQYHAGHYRRYYHRYRHYSQQVDLNRL